MPVEAIVFIVLINVALIVVFCIMAANVAKIKNKIGDVVENTTKIRYAITAETATKAEIYIQEAELLAYVGDYQSAIKNYLFARCRYEKRYDMHATYHGGDKNDIRIAEIDEAIAKLQAIQLKQD